MTPIIECLINKKTDVTPIWLMRQAGRYLPEFREIRKVNKNFINLCLNAKLSEEITLQPINRFDFDAAIIFSDILMVPYGLGQNVQFKKNFGPNLGKVDLESRCRAFCVGKCGDFIISRGIVLLFGKKWFVSKFFY